MIFSFWLKVKEKMKTHLNLVSLNLLVGQLHVELFIVDPLGADDRLGVLVGLQLLRIIVNLQQFISCLQLGIPRHLA